MSTNDQLNILAGLMPTPQEILDEMDPEGLLFAHLDVPETGNASFSEHMEDELSQVPIIAGMSNEGAIHADTDNMGDNFVFFDEFPEFDYDTERRLARIAEELRFTAPGERMLSSPQDERRAKKRELNEVKKVEKLYYHNSEGLLISPNREPLRICDCLVPTCIGCHSECDTCNTRYCGPTCQISRPYALFQMEINGGDKHINPYLQELI